MGDQAKFSDDISGLWGSDDSAGLHPALPATGPRPASNGGPTGGDERLSRLEGHLGALAKALDALRGEVLAQIDLGLAGTDRRMGEATTRLVQRVAALEAQVPEHTHPHEHEPPPVADLEQEFARELIAVRAAAEAEIGRHLAEAEARLRQRIDERLGALEARTALLGESIEAYRREAVREPHLDAIRADLQAAADEIAAATDDRVDRHLHEVAAHVTQATARDLAALDARVTRLSELLDSHRVQSVMGWELESLRGELVGAVSAELAELRAQLAAGRGNGDDVDAERRRFEASWQQSMPGF